MRFSIEARTLLSMVKEARSPIPSVPDSPTAAAVRMRVEGGILSVHGWGPSGTSSQYHRSAEDSKDGEMLVSPRPLETFLKFLGQRVAVIESSAEGDLLVSCGDVREYVFRGVPGEHPEQSREWGDGSDVDGGRLASALASVKRSADGEERAVHLRIREGELLLEATDNYRLSQASVGGVALPDSSLVVAAGDMESSVRLGVTNLSISSDRSSLKLSGDGFARTVRALSRAFPPVDSLVLRQLPFTVGVDAQEMADALRRVQAVAQGRPATLVLGESVEVRSANPDVGSGRENLSSTGGSGHVEMSLRAEYILDVAESSEGVIEIFYENESSAIRFHSQQAVHVVMPIRRA